MRGLGECSGLSSQRLSPVPHPLERSQNIGRDPTVAAGAEMNHGRLGRRITPEVRVHEQLIIEAEERVVERRAGDADGAGSASRIGLA